MFSSSPRRLGSRAGRIVAIDRAPIRLSHRDRLSGRGNRQRRECLKSCLERPFVSERIFRDARPRRSISSRAAKISNEKLGASKRDERAGVHLFSSASVGIVRERNFSIVANILMGPMSRVPLGNFNVLNNSQRKEKFNAARSENYGNLKKKLTHKLSGSRHCRQSLFAFVIP